MRGRHRPARHAGHNDVNQCYESTYGISRAVWDGSNRISIGSNRDPAAAIDVPDMPVRVRVRRSLCRSLRSALRACGPDLGRADPRFGPADPHAGHLDRTAEWVRPDPAHGAPSCGCAGGSSGRADPNPGHRDPRAGAPRRTAGTAVRRVDVPSRIPGTPILISGVPTRRPGVPNPVATDLSATRFDPSGVRSDPSEIARDRSRSGPAGELPLSFRAWARPPGVSARLPGRILSGLHSREGVTDQLPHPPNRLTASSDPQPMVVHLTEMPSQVPHEVDEEALRRAPLETRRGVAGLGGGERGDHREPVARTLRQARSVDRRCERAPKARSTGGAPCGMALSVKTHSFGVMVLDALCGERPDGCPASTSSHRRPCTPFATRTYRKAR